MASMPGLLDLAAAGALDLGRAADIASNIMSGFAIDASQAGHVSDVLAKAAASANTDVEQLGNAMQYLAPVSNALGWELEEATSAVMALSDAGLQGEKAGAAFSTSLTRITSPSKEAAGVIRDLGFEFFTAEGQMKSMPEVIAEIEKGTKGLNQEQKAAAISTIFGLESYKAWAVLLEKGSTALGKNAQMLKNADGAAKKMADTMNDNAKGSMKEMMSALEGLAIELGKSLLPLVTDAVKKITSMARSFGELSPEAQKTILAIGGIAAAIGPVIMVTGTLVSSIGAITGAVGAASGAIAGAGGLGAALSGVVAAGGPITLAIAGLAALGIGAYKLHQEMKKPAIEVELFGDKVSKSTKKAVGSYLDLDEQATVSLNELAWSQKTITQELSDQLVSTFDQMGDKILAEMQRDHAAQLETIQTFFSKRAALSQEEEAIIIEKQKQFQGQQEEQVQISQDRIKDILNTAKEEKRALTEAERIEINGIQTKMKETAVQVLSESEAEQKAILESLRVQATEISALQAAEVVKNAVDQKDKVVAEAQAQYQQTVAEIVKMRDESGIISNEQANKLIEEATRQRDDVITRAEETHSGVVSEAQKQAGEHVDIVNWETGEVMSKWEVLNKNTATTIASMSANAISEFKKMQRGAVDTADALQSSFVRKIGDLKSGASSKLNELAHNFLDFKDRVTGYFARMVLKIPKIQMPKMPKFSLSTGSREIMGKTITYPNGIDVTWHKKGGVFNKEVIMGNAGFGDVEEAIVPFEGPHAARIAGLIGKEMVKYLGGNEKASQPSVNVYIGDEEIKDVMFDYVDGKQNLRHFENSYMGGYTK
jgi:TP901 family phage tail tape measure protein